MTSKYAEWSKMVTALYKGESLPSSVRSNLWEKTKRAVGEDATVIDFFDYAERVAPRMIQQAASPTKAGKLVKARALAEEGAAQAQAEYERQIEAARVAQEEEQRSRIYAEEQAMGTEDFRGFPPNVVDEAEVARERAEAKAEDERARAAEMAERAEVEAMGAEDFRAELKKVLPSLDPDSRQAVLQSLLERFVVPTEEELVDDLGMPLSMDKLVQIAQISPIWGSLSKEQKAQFLEETGSLANGRSYVSRRIVPKPVRKRSQMVHTASGERVYV